MGKKFTTAVVVAGVLGLTALANVDAPESHADETSFLVDMAEAGFVNSGGLSSEAIAGVQICAELSSGWSQYAAAHDLWLRSRIETLEVAQRFVSIALHDLCPQNATIA